MTAPSFALTAHSARGMSALRLIAALSAVLAGLLVSACDPDAGSQRHADIAAATEALTGNNGIHVNGIHVNGIHVNGIHVNGIHVNAIYVNAMRLGGVALEGLDFGELTVAGEWLVDLEPAQRAGFEQLLKYMIECAVAGGDSVAMRDEYGQAVEYDGVFGLAPSWATQPLSPAQEHSLSACLAARSNMLGQTVQISLSGAGIALDPGERDLFPSYEGAFWGNLFADESYIRTCTVSGGGLSGRVCTESEDCGFELTGSCADVCQAQDADGAYTDCAGVSEVLSTFLPLGARQSFGAGHGCFVSASGELACWGQNGHGELGPAGSSLAHEEPVLVSALGANVAEVSAGDHVSCARLGDGSVSCWGQNHAGQLGDGTRTDRATPVQVAALGHDTASLAVYKEHACAVHTDGSVRCWGAGSAGQLGDGASTESLQPVMVADVGHSVVRLASGASASASCSIDTKAQLWCWGSNASGQLGDGTTQEHAWPVQVAQDAAGSPLPPVTDACVGAAHACARTADGQVMCWGEDSVGQLGDGPEATPRSRPVRVSMPGAAASGTLSCGAYHTCVARADGSAWCWGDAASGALGDGSSVQPWEPVQVSGLAGGVVRLSAASKHSCASLSDGSLWCWGSDRDGLMVPGTLSSVPTQLPLVYAP